MNQNGDHTMMLLDYSPCPSGTYINALTITDQTYTTVYDTAGNTYSASAQTFYDNIGTLYYFGTGTVVSNNRNTYPDDGRQGLCYYKFHPERTKFIEYTEDTDITINAELYHDRYTYTHDNTYYNRNTSLYNTVIGTIDSTNENSIPNASWRKYYGVYLGDTIPYLNLVEQVIPPADILGVPTYDKQINTSDTLKYGTVASAAISFNMNMPVDEAMTYNNELLILFYDFENKDEWTRMGFFYVDSIEAIDEYTTHITAHDEAYKLNKYVDGFLEGYASSVSLKNFCYQLFTYCGCYYDTAMPNFPQSDLTLDNVYHAVKTTGTEVAHYIASIVPAFIHADIDSDIVIGQYHSIPETIGVDKYTELKYTAYNSDNVNKVKITSNNEIIAEDGGTGENVYYLADNPLINTSWADATLINIANTVKNTYTSIPQYRPATIKFLTLPENIKIGDAFIINTPTNQTYRVLVMRISVDASGVEIESIGTQQFPVEASSTGQFINILNDIEGVSGDVADVDGKVSSLEAIVIATASNMTTLSQNITTVAGTVSTLSGRVDNLSTQQNSTANKVNAMSVSSSNNLATVAINGNTVSQIAMKDYVDTNAAIMKTGVLIYRDDDNISYNQNVMYIGNRAYTQGVFIPLGYGHGSGGYLMYKVETSSLYGMAYQGEYQGQMFNISFWANLHNHTFTPNN